MEYLIVDHHQKDVLRLSLETLRIMSAALSNLSDSLSWFSKDVLPNIRATQYSYI